MHPEPAQMVYDEEWAAQQAQDEAIEKRELEEAFNRLYGYVTAAEKMCNCTFTDWRRDLRFLELVLYRK